MGTKVHLSVMAGTTAPPEGTRPLPPVRTAPTCPSWGEQEPEKGKWTLGAQRRTSLGCPAGSTCARKPRTPSPQAEGSWALGDEPCDRWSPHDPPLLTSEDVIAWPHRRYPGVQSGQCSPVWAEKRKSAFLHKPILLHTTEARRNHPVRLFVTILFSGWGDDNVSSLAVYATAGQRWGRQRPGWRAACRRQP